jgi:hypothetical protein
LEKGEIFGVVEVVIFVGVEVSCSGDLVKVVVVVVTMVGIVVGVGVGVVVGFGVGVKSMALTSMVKKRFFV